MVDEPTAGGRPPGPSTLPLVGNLLAYVRDPFGFREACAATYGDVVDVSALGRRVYLVTHPETIERVLVDDHDRFGKPGFEMGFVDDVFGRGLSFIEGEAWRRRRRILQPTFYRERIAGYADPMAATARDLAADWDDGQRVRLDEAMATLTLRVLCRTLFGIEPTAARGDLVAAFRSVNDRHRLPQALLPAWLPTRTNRRYRAGVATLEATIDELIERRRPAEDGPGGADPDGGRGADLLSALLAASDGRGEGDGLSTDAVRDELMGFLFAGHETTAMGLTFALHLLSANPGVRERLRSRLRTVVDGGVPDPGTLESVPLLDRVVSESLRLYPPSHSVARETLEDVTLRGYEVPAGSSLHLPQWVVQRDDRWYDDPAAFDPGRWADGVAGDRPDYAYFPFGGGPRQCIGMRFARLELRTALATLLLHCTVETDATDPELEAGLTLRPAAGVEATVGKTDAG